MTLRIGFSGLGRMGLAMAARLRDAEFPVIGFDPDARRTAELAELGGEARSTNRAVAEDADVVLACLPSADALQAAVSDEDGLLAAEKTGAVIVETSTLGLADKHAAKTAADVAGLVLLDCPLSGGPPAARDGQLAIFPSGDHGAVERCAPVFRALAHTSDYVGEFGMGTKMKLFANLLVAVHNVTTAEVLTLGRKAGVDPNQLCEVLSRTSGDSRMLRRRGPKMATGDFSSAGGISLELFSKDLRLIEEFARSVDCPLPMLSTAAELYESALAWGLGDSDSSSVYVALNRLAGLVDATPSAAAAPPASDDED